MNAHERRLRVAAALKDGLSYREIAAELGVPYHTVCRDVSRARALKLLPPRLAPDPYAQTTTKLRALELAKGTIGSCLGELTDDERAWLFDSAKRDGYVSVAEYLTDLIRTAYDAEKGDEL